MPAVSQNTINKVTVPIVNHIRQAPQESHVAPNPDRKIQNQFQRIDGDIEVIHTMPASLQTGLDTRVIQHQRQRNSLVRLHQLPLEIVSNILWLSIADPWEQNVAYSFLRRQQTISSVCSSWRNLVESSPRFWSIIEFSCSQRGISHLLKKSRCSSLEIKCFSDSKYDCKPPHYRRWLTEDRYLRLIAPHTDRIRLLILSVTTAEGLLSVLKNPAPMLEELKIDAEDVYGYLNFMDPVVLFCGQADRLRDVALKNIPFRWDSRVLVGLRSLEVQGNIDYSSAEDQMRRLLEANPGLEEMDIQDLKTEQHVKDDAAKSTGGGRPSRVVMSKMRRLRLVDLPFELVLAVLSNIEIPSIKHLELKCLLQGQPASRLLGPKIDHVVPTLLQQSKGTQQAEVVLGISSVGLAIYLPGYESPTIRIKLKHTVPASGFEWLAENFFHAEGLPYVGAAEVFQVSLKFRDGFDLAGGTFIPILDGLSAVKVKTLTIEERCRNGEALINYLGRLKVDSQWPLPQLTSLTVGGPPQLATPLLLSLQRRKHHAPANKSSTAPRPVTLDFLDVKSLRGMGGKMEKALAKFISSDGTFIRGSPWVLTNWR